MKSHCDNCYLETEELIPVGGYLACEDCFTESQMPWYLRLAEGQ